MEAADNGLILPEIAAGIARARGARQVGVRLGHWLTKEQADQLLAIPNHQTVKGMRDRAILALLVGAGLRRSELAGLNCEDIQQRQGRWLVVDLKGKHGRVRSVPLPDWAESMKSAWQNAAQVTGGALFRAVTRHGRVSSSRLSAQAVFAIVKECSVELGTIVRPHDLRRTFASWHTVAMHRSNRSNSRWGTPR
jgi:integrase